MGWVQAGEGSSERGQLQPGLALLCPLLQSHPWLSAGLCKRGSPQGLPAGGAQDRLSHTVGCIKLTRQPPLAAELCQINHHSSSPFPKCIDFSNSLPLRATDVPDPVDSANRPPPRSSCFQIRRKAAGNQQGDLSGPGEGSLLGSPWWYLLSRRDNDRDRSQGGGGSCTGLMHQKVTACRD